MYVCMYVYNIYIYIYTHVYIHTYNTYIFFSGEIHIFHAKPPRVFIGSELRWFGCSSTVSFSRHPRAAGAANVRGPKTLRRPGEGWNGSILRVEVS